MRSAGAAGWAARLQLELLARVEAPLPPIGAQLFVECLLRAPHSPQKLSALGLIPSGVLVHCLEPATPAPSSALPYKRLLVRLLRLPQASLQAAAITSLLQLLGAQAEARPASGRRTNALKWEVAPLATAPVVAALEWAAGYERHSADAADASEESWGVAARAHALAARPPEVMRACEGFFAAMLEL
eukprot:SAG11_NODE_628_length_8077_cov_4.820632_3_plen_187_part_00